MSACPICQSTHTHIEIKNGFDDRHGYVGYFSILRCKICEHQFLDQAFSDQEILNQYRIFYPRSQLDLNQIRPLKIDFGWKGWLRGDQASAAAWAKENSKVLDVGCGFGESLLYLQDLGCETFGIDADDNILRVASKFHLNAKTGLLSRDSFPHQQFDMILLNQVVEHVSHLDSFFETLTSYLKQDGKIVFTTPNAFSFFRRVFGRRWIHWHIPYHLHFFSQKSFQMILKRHGLEIQKIAYVTPSDWLLFQWLHLFSRIKPGLPTDIWNHGRGHGLWWVLNTALKIFHRLRINHLLVRLLDSLGLGDNQIVIVQLSKNQRALRQGQKA